MKARPRFRRHPKMQNGPGKSPRPFARTDKSVPRQGHTYYRANAATNQFTSRRVAPRPANPPLVPERQSSRRKVDSDGFEPPVRNRLLRIRQPVILISLE